MDTGAKLMVPGAKFKGSLEQCSRVPRARFRVSREKFRVPQNKVQASGFPYHKV